MLIATLNVYNTDVDWDRRREVLRAGFATMAPDLVTLQETIVTDGYDQAREILGDGYHVVQQRTGEPDGQAVSIASRAGSSSGSMAGLPA